jgi:hypothetical protein
MTDNLDDDILREIGFTKYDDLKAFLQKLKDFSATLNTVEKKVFRANLSTCAEAVLTFSFEVTQEQLSAYIKGAEPGCDDFSCCINGTGHSKGGKRQ